MAGEGTSTAPRRFLKQGVHVRCSDLNTRSLRKFLHFWHSNLDQLPHTCRLQRNGMGTSSGTGIHHIYIYTRIYRYITCMDPVSKKASYWSMNRGVSWPLLGIVIASMPPGRPLGTTTAWFGQGFGNTSGSERAFRESVRGKIHELLMHNVSSSSTCIQRAAWIGSGVR